MSPIFEKSAQKYNPEILIHCKYRLNSIQWSMVARGSSVHVVLIIKISLPDFITTTR